MSHEPSARDPLSGPADELMDSVAAACDEALKEGSLDEVLDELPQTMRARLHKGLACADLLRRVLPAQHSTLAGPQAVPPPVKELPRRLGRFAIQRELGRGGFGIVYLAFDPGLNREVALKIPREDVLVSPELRERFHQEARAAACLDHPGLVAVYEAGEIGPVAYIASAFCPGITLAQLLKDRTESVPAREAAALLAQMADALDHAHRRGVIHRDIKPGNILLQPPANAEADAVARLPLNQFTARITDFGLACVKGEDLDRLTQTGQLLGTPSYMAPEQLDGPRDAVTPATDVYGLGAVLYELLTGCPPFRAATVLATLQQVRDHDPVPPSQFHLGCPRDLQTIVLTCLHKDPARRYANAAALAADLGRVLDGQPIAARPVGPVERIIKWSRRHPTVAGLAAAVAASILLGFAGVSWQWYRADRERAGAVRAWGQAEANRLDEERQREIAQDRWYLNQIARIQQELRSNNGPQARRLLQECQTLTPQRCNWEWHYLKRQCHNYLFSLPEQPQYVMSVSYSSCGRYLATGTGEWNGSDPSFVRVWDAATGRMLRDLKGPTSPVYHLAFQPHGRLLAAAELHGNVWVWDRDDPDAPPLRLQQDQRVYSIAFRPDGKQLAFGLGDGTVKVWDFAADTVVRRRRLGTHLILHLAYHPDGKRLAAACRDGNVYPWEVDGDKPLTPLRHSADARRVAFSPDGRHLATAGWEGNLKLWDLTQPDSRPTSYPLGGGSISAVAFSPDSARLALGLADGRLMLWNFRSAGEPDYLRGHGGQILGVAFSPDGRRLVGGSADRTAKVWDLVIPPDPQGTHVPDTVIVGMAISPDGTTLALAGGFNRASPGVPGRRAVLLHDVATGQSVALPQAQTWQTSIAYRPDGEQVAAGGTDGHVRFWDVKQRKLTHDLPGPDSVIGVAYSRSGRLLASAHREGVQVWNPRDGQKLSWLPHPAPVVTLAFGPNEELITADEGRTVRIWDVTSGTSRPLDTHTEGLAGLGVSPDGNHLVAVDRALRLRVWDAHTWEETTAEDRIASGIVAGDTPSTRRITVQLAFSPDSRRLIVLGSNARLDLVEVPTGRRVLHLATPADFRGSSVAFCPLGKQIYSAQSYTLLTWDAEYLEPAERVRRVEKQVPRFNQVWSDYAEWLAKNNGVETNLRPGGWFASAFHTRQRIVAEPLEANWHAKLGNAEAEQGHWRAAQESYATVVRLAPHRATDWYNRAIAHLGSGDRAGYRAICQEAIRRYEGTRDGRAAAALLFASLPGGAGDPEKLLKLAHIAVDQGKWSRRLLGAALCRVGAYQEALDHFDFADKSYPWRAWDHLFRAMAYHHLGNSEKAREAFDRATAWIEETEAEKARPQRWIGWRERPEVEALRAEVEALLGSR